MSDALVVPAVAARRQVTVLPWLLCGALAGFAFLVLAGFSVIRIDVFNAGLRDLDIQNQVIWNTAHGRPFASTVLKENRLHIAEHLAFSLLPLSAVYAVWPEQRMLVVLQALALAGASIPVYLYAHRQLHNPLHALIIQCSLVAMPLTASIAL